MSGATFSYLRVLIHKRSFDASALPTGGTPRTGWHMNGAPTAVRLASGGWAAAAGLPQPQPQPQQPQQPQPQHPVPHQHSAAMQPPPQMPEPMGPNDPRWHHIAPGNRPSWAAPPSLHLQPHPMAQSPQPVRLDPHLRVRLKQLLTSMRCDQTTAQMQPQMVAQAPPQAPAGAAMGRTMTLAREHGTFG